MQPMGDVSPQTASQLHTIEPSCYFTFTNIFYPLAVSGHFVRLPEEKGDTADRLQSNQASDAALKLVLRLSQREADARRKNRLEDREADGGGAAAGGRRPTGRRSGKADILQPHLSAR
ncbi:hypothetical protein EYF80_045039 [Liparis tanakae]|uniref:Uncharacterized protein n=1 Tax=Liparis tanakae TaxID=230148 RepID=A0A4Z2FUB6_9TELE|nr:hypothetical protein EYF80_045039 [Liparis tanakae]